MAVSKPTFGSSEKGKNKQNRRITLPRTACCCIRCILNWRCSASRQIAIFWLRQSCLLYKPPSPGHTPQPCAEAAHNWVEILSRTPEIRQNVEENVVVSEDKLLTQKLAAFRLYWGNYLFQPPDSQWKSVPRPWRQHHTEDSDFVLITLLLPAFRLAINAFQTTRFMWVLPCPFKL